MLIKLEKSGVGYWFLLSQIYCYKNFLIRNKQIHVTIRYISRLRIQKTKNGFQITVT